MRMSTLLSPTLRGVPSEAEIASHRLMLRGGLIRRAASGIYTFLPLAHRVLDRIEKIVREELDARQGQEIRLPIVQPSEMWKQSGRWDEYGEEMFKLKDRHGREFCLGPTHEEIITTLVREEVHSYKALPLLLYQIQNKYRDEIRPRFGVMRSREFIMKDLYSFDRDEEGMEKSYQAMYEAYDNIFRRCGLDFRVVEADSGTIGGDTTHEFVALADTGEAVVIHCLACGYAASQERAVAREDVPPGEAVSSRPEEIHTPGARTIEDLRSMMNIKASDIAKTLFYRATYPEGEPQLVAVVIRGDRQVNEVKLTNYLGCLSLELAGDEAVLKRAGVPIGSAGPAGLMGVRVLVDEELAQQPQLVTGANRKDYHLKGVVPGRDFSLEARGDFRLVQEGYSCQICGSELRSQRGIEVGQVFQLGTKYSVALGANFTDADGIERPLVMGCYGIGITRTMAAIVEQCHDERGIIWPWAVSPYDVSIVVINSGDSQQGEAAERLYRDLWEAGVTAVLDEREESPGVKFADADLMGFPLRVTIGPRSLKEGKCEIKSRSTGEEVGVYLAEAVQEILSWPREQDVT